MLCSPRFRCCGVAVWISSDFTEEHRATLDWLNNITGERFSFFGLELELWRIGDSPCAPRFNVVSKPNEWTKPTAAPINATQQLQLEYWTGLQDILKARKGKVKPGKLYPRSWSEFAVGTSNNVLFAGMRAKDQTISVGLWISDANAQTYLEQLLEQRGAIEGEIGESLGWSQVEGQKARVVRLDKADTDTTLREEWPRQHAWLADKLEAFYEAFAPRVAAIKSNCL